MALGFFSMIILHSLSVFPLRLILQTSIAKNCHWKKDVPKNTNFLFYFSSRINNSKQYFFLFVLIVKSYRLHNVENFISFFIILKLFYLSWWTLTWSYVTWIWRLEHVRVIFFPKQFGVAWIQVFKSLS